jgi:DNA-binding ferritin-like protein
MAKKNAPKKNAAKSPKKSELSRQKIRELGEIEGNPVGLDKKACKEIAGHLDRHLATYNVLYNQYHKHHWLVMGPQFRDLHLFLEDHYNQIHKHLDQIAERMTVLGAIPTCSPTEQAKIAYVEHEPEGQFRNRDMLEQAILCEKRVCNEMRGTIKVALEHDDFGTKRLAEKWLQYAEDRAHHLEHFLEADTLEVGLTADASEVQEDPVLEAMDG